MPKANRVATTDIYTITARRSGGATSTTRCRCIFRGCPRPFSPPHDRAHGAPTCSVGISPEGLYNRLNDAGRLILLNHNGVPAWFRAVRCGSHGKTFHAHDQGPAIGEGPDDVPALKNYYILRLPRSRPVCLLPRPWRSWPTSSAKIKVVRRLISSVSVGDRSRADADRRRGIRGHEHL